jgi:hypothetical protein
MCAHTRRVTTVPRVSAVFASSSRPGATPLHRWRPPGGFRSPVTATSKPREPLEIEGSRGLVSCFESRRENKLRTNVSGGGLRCRCRGLGWRHDRRVNGRVDRPISGLCEGAGDGVEGVGLDILRHGRGGMTEYPLDDLHVRAGADGEAGCGVAHGLRVRHPPSRRNTSRCLLRPGLTRSCVVSSRTRHSALNQTA